MPHNTKSRGDPQRHVDPHRCPGPPVAVPDRDPVGEEAPSSRVFPMSEALARERLPPPSTGIGPSKQPLNKPVVAGRSPTVIGWVGGSILAMRDFHGDKRAKKGINGHSVTTERLTGQTKANDD